MLITEHDETWCSIEEAILYSVEERMATLRADLDQVDIGMQDKGYCSDAHMALRYVCRAVIKRT